MHHTEIAQLKAIISDNSKRKYFNEVLMISHVHILYLEKYEPQVKETGGNVEVKEWLYT